VLIGSIEATIAVLFAVVVLAPIVAERFQIPSIVGLIAGGMVFGPSMVGWLEAGGLVDELGSIGILYLMFLAGLSFDLKSFTANRRIAIIYGLLGFFIPFILTVFLINRSSEVEALGALLIGAMWASNTLVAYPEAQAAGVAGTRSVGAAVAAGVVADLLSLTVMALVTATAVIEVEPTTLPFGSFIESLVPSSSVEPTTPDPALPLWVGLPVLLLVCLLVLPRAANWFFTRVGRARSQRFVFTLALMGAGATVALLGGMEGLIGAFLVGLGMNRLVPTRGALMERLDFTGTTLFVPVFLVSIGLSIDPALLFDLKTIGIGALFAGLVVVGKSAAALITGLVSKLSLDEIGLMSSLSFGQAASTLAIAEVGSGLGLFDQDIVNAAVLAIVITAFITSYGTRFFARRVTVPKTDQPTLGEQILLDAGHGHSDRAAVAMLAGAISRRDDGLVMPYAVSDGEGQVAARDAVALVSEEASALGLDVDGLLRVDDSFIEATIHIVSEHGASCVLLDWEGLRWASDYLFGNDVDAIGIEAPVPCLAMHLLRPWDRVVVYTGKSDSSWRRSDAQLAVEVALRARLADPVPLVLLGDNADLVTELLADRSDETVTTMEGTDAELSLEVGPTDLVVVPAHVIRDLPPWRVRRLAQGLEGVNVLVVGGPHRLTISQRVYTQHVATSATQVSPPR
jgi:Kef-type K+ transport system membrane component KefB